MPAKTSNCLETRSGFWRPGIKIVGKKFVLVTLFLFAQFNLVKTAPTNKQQGKQNVNIISKNGKYLTVTDTEVKGKDLDNPFAKLETHSVGNGELTIRGVKANKFIIMNKTGQVSLATTELVPEAVFIDVYLPGNLPYRSYRSKLYPSYYLAISSTGVVTGSTVKNSPDVQLQYF